MIPDYKVRIYEPDYSTLPITCTLIFDTEDDTNPDREEVISISASRTVSGETPEAEVVFDNDPRKDFKEGDIIEIEVGWKSPLTTHKVFSGIIYEATEYSDDEDKTITVRAKDWSCLLLTDKVTLSYPNAENVAQIVLDIIETVGAVTIEGLFQADTDDGYVYKEEAAGYSVVHDATSGTVEDESTLIKIGQKCEKAPATWAVDNYTEIVNDGWTFNGSSPYLDAIDESYIEHDASVGQTDKYIAKFGYEDIPTWVTITGRQFWIVARTSGLVGDDDYISIECLLYGPVPHGSPPDWVQVGFFSFYKTETSWTQKGISINGYPFNTWTPDDWNNVFLKIRLVGLAGTNSPIIQITESHLAFTYSSDYRYTIQRGALFFDTSSLAGNMIASAYLTLYATDKEISQDFDLQLQRGIPGYPHKPLIGADYRANRYSENLGTIDGDIIVEDDFFNIDVDKNYINKTGITNLVLRTTPDISSTPPGDDEEGTVFVASFDHGTPSFRPVLHVFYYSISLCELQITAEIGPGHIEDDLSTRQLDFVGEAKVDALNKVDDVCEHDWYVNDNKDFQYFPRFSRPAVPKTLTAEDLEDYSVADPYDNLCNKIDFYGNSHKLLPYDGKAWTQTLTGWADALGGTLSIYTDPNSGEKFVQEVDAPACEIYLDITAVDSEVDLTLKGAYKTLSFIMWMAADTTGYAPGIKLILLAPDYANRFVYPMWDTFNPVQYNQLYQIPIGPDNEESGHWQVGAGDPDWSQIAGIMWEKDSANPTTLKIGALRFADGKYFGTAEDVPSQTTYGIKYRELFDETVFSNVAAQRRAEKLVSKFKEPIGVVSNVILEFTADPSEPAPWNIQGQEYLEPGDKIIFSDSITEFAGLTEEQRTYRIETITHKISEDLEYTCELVVSLDPVMFEGQVASISERARRLEQKYTRKPAAEPSEVD